MNQMAVVPPALPGSASFSGKRGDFRALVTRGALLELVTVGFYRFWLTTDIRRHLWSDTAVDDDAFEYTGRGKELLIGFLFALAIIVPVDLGYLLISVEAARFKACASFPLLARFYLFGRFAIDCSRRSPFMSSRSRPLSMPRSRRWNGAGGFQACALAACVWNRICRAVP